MTQTIRSSIILLAIIAAGIATSCKSHKIATATEPAKPHYYHYADGHFFYSWPNISSSELSLYTLQDGKAKVFIHTLPDSVSMPDELLATALLPDTLSFIDEFNSYYSRHKAMKDFRSNGKEMAVGSPFPAFSQTDTDGRHWNNDSLRGKVAVFNLWFTGCGPCLKEMPELSKWREEFPEVNFLAVNYEAAEEAVPVAQKRGFTWHQLDGDSPIHSWLPSYSPYPTTIIVNPEGIITMIAHGASEQTHLNLVNEIRRLDEGRKSGDVKPYANFSQWMTLSEIKRVPQSYLLDFSTRPKWSYVMGIELEAMLDTYFRYGDDHIKYYCVAYTDTMINQDGTIRNYKLEDYNLDNVRTGHFVARMYDYFRDEKELKAMQTLMRQLAEQPRTKEGVYWHKAIYAYQVWLDGIFMGLPYRVLTASMLYSPDDAKPIYDDAVDQVKKTYERTLDPATGLNRHAWDENRDMFWSDDTTGLSQHCWGRAQGWYAMALIEILDALPDDYQRKGEVVELLRKTLDSIIKWQDPDTGVWYQVMDSPGRDGNYLESTCSSMFAYTLLKAARKGYVGDSYRQAGIKAYEGIIDRFIKVNPDGTISLTDCCAVAGLGPGMSPAVKAAAPKVKENTKRDGSYEYYLSEPVRDNDAKGVGPFIWASLEMESLGYHTDMMK